METPLTLLTLGFYTKIGGSRDPPVPRESPAQNIGGLLVLSSVPPGTATRWRPPYLHCKQSSRLWQCPRETPAQTKFSSVGQLPGGDPPIFIQGTNLNKVHGVTTLAIPQGDPCSEHRGSACSEQRPPRDSYQVETPLSSFN